MLSLRQLHEAEVFDLFDNIKLSQQPAWFTALFEVGRSTSRGNRTIDLPVLLGQSIDCRLQFISVGDGPHRTLSALSELPAVHPSWAPIVAAARFIGSPSAQTLADTLRVTATVFEQNKHMLTIPTNKFPWPLAECIEACVSADDFERLAFKVESGDLGDLTDWLEAESRWTSCDGDMLDALTDERWPFNRNSIRKFPPFRSAAVLMNFKGGATVTLEYLLSFWDRLPISRVRTEVAELILRLHGTGWSRYQVKPKPNARQYLQLARDDGKYWIDLNIFYESKFQEDISEDWVELFDFIVNQRRLKGLAVANSKLPEFVSSLIMTHPDQSGLVKLLGALVIQGYVVQESITT